jgi:WD40 repeat protein
VSADGRYFLGLRHQPNLVKVWDTKTGKIVFEHPAVVGRFTPDSKQVVLSENFTELSVHGIASGKQVREFDTGVGLWNFSTAPVGSRLFYLTPDGYQIWDRSTGKKLCQLPRKQEDYHVFLPDGRHLLTREGGKASLQVVDMENGNKEDAPRPIRDIPGLRGVDGDFLLACPDPSNLKLYDRNSGRLLWAKDVGTNAVAVVCAGRVLSTCNLRDELWLWDARTGRLLARLHFSQPPDLPRATIRLSGDGRYAAVAGPEESLYVFRLPEPPPE